MERDPSTEPMSLAGKRAIVTGASRGIGREIAASLLRRGARVALFARNRDLLEQTTSQLDGEATAIACDISDPGSVRTAFDRVDQALGGLDVLVNNAGMAGLDRIEDCKDDDLRAAVDTNILGLVHMTREAVPRLRAAGGGNIVNVSSTTVNDPYPYLSMYAATKAAVEMLSVALRREVAADGTRVTVLRLGPSFTAFNDGWDAKTSARAFKEWIDKGYAGWDGAMNPAVVGEAVAQAVCYPRQIGLDFFEINPTAFAPLTPTSPTRGVEPR